MKVFWNKRPYAEDEHTISPEKIAEIRAKAALYEINARRAQPTTPPEISSPWNARDEHDIPEQPADDGLHAHECTLSGLGPSDQLRMLTLMRRHVYTEDLRNGVEELIRVEDYE